MKTKWILVFALWMVAMPMTAQGRQKPPAGDREVWSGWCYRIAQPILENMSRGELQKNMTLELSPTWDGRDRRVAYMEAFGRSVVYRMGAFQTLALAAWKYGLPEGLAEGQVRSALTAVMKNMFAVEGNFDERNFLRLGFVGHQPDLSNYYTNNGSLYMTSLVYLPLGLPADHPFWTAPAQPWTSQKAWSGKPFPIDGHVSLRQ